jgi:hypothetical protein
LFFYNIQIHSSLPICVYCVGGKDFMLAVGCFGFLAGWKASPTRLNDYPEMHFMIDYWVAWGYI